MKIKKSEHITRYTIYKDGERYIRLVEKDINNKSKISWMVIDSDDAYFVEDKDSNELEIEFLKTLE